MVNLRRWDEGDDLRLFHRNTQSLVAPSPDQSPGASGEAGLVVCRFTIVRVQCVLCIVYWFVSSYEPNARTTLVFAHSP